MKANHSPTHELILLATADKDMMTLGAGNGINGMLRKKYHVVRKKYHVVRKLFYVASILGGAARLRNMPPWELSSTAGHFSSTASLSMRLPNTRFLGALSNKFA